MDNNSKNKYWQSISGAENSNVNSSENNSEFLPGTFDNFDLENKSNVSRRKFLALLSASAALTATACTDYRDKGQIIPYNVRPDEVLPGTANYYASTCDSCSNKCGILIKTREGRPIKIDGNPEHPINKGKICATGQSSLLNLYDPNRLKNPLFNNKEINWDRIDDKIINALTDCKNNNLEIALVTNSIYSPSTFSVINKLKEKYPTLNVYSYELFDNTNYLNSLKKCYNINNKPKIDISKAKIIVSLENDFLGKGENFLENIAEFSKNRDINNIDGFNRLYAIESGLSVTGSNADYRIRINPELYELFIISIINELVINKGLALKNSSIALTDLIKGNDLSKLVDQYKLDKKEIGLLISDLVKYRNETVVVTGNNLSENLHILVNLLNDILNSGSLINFNIADKNLAKLNTYKDLKTLTHNMVKGKIGMVIHFDTDPVFHFPKELKYKESISKLKYSVTLCESINDTSEISSFVLPINNQQESWGIFNKRAELYSFQQPVIAPLNSSRQKEAILLNWLEEGKTNYDEFIYHKYLITYFTETIYPKINTLANVTEIWNNCLHDGVLELSNNSSEISVGFNYNVLSEIKIKQPNNGFSVILDQNYFILDGKYANNGWLQEIPHPISKVAWDNYASISPTTAKQYSLEMNDLIEIKSGWGKLIIPVLVQPGVADNVAVIELGFGRSIVGDVGKDVGVNANILLNANGDSSFIIENVSIKKTGEVYELASSQEHHAIDDPMTRDLHLTRNIIQEGTVLEYKKNHKFLDKNKTEIFSITNEFKYKDMKWGMSIDLNKCIGCGICVSACNVENNIPVVGKEEYGKGREMHWMRIDRYYSGEPDKPLVSNQPMLCQHCDNAPCENVCPVNATNHSDDGINQMTYNRCVGTRYCANNCPYKVRRFNFYNFRDNFENAYYDNDLSSLVNNPEVTVRSRGVMEKCTFCVQKIMEARQEAIKNNIPLKGSDVVTACQQACPSQAIVFGNVNDKESELSKYRNHELGYYVLEALNIKPNVTYIAKLRNTHSEEI